MNLRNLIDENSLILRDGLSEYMCLFNSYLLENATEQWKYNRNLSNEKIQSIIDNIKDKTILDTVLHFMYVKDDKERLICFDGNHRREALILLNKKYGINIGVCCYIYICSNINNVDREIVDKFKIINQMTPIPDIYNDIIENLDSIGDNNLLNRKNIIETIFNKYKKEYKSFYSVNAKCRRPNFNETTFKDLCNNLKFKSEIELEQELCKLNEDKQRYRSKLCSSNNIIAKCETQKFYLFI